MVVAGDLDSSKLSTADCLSSFVLQNSMAGPAREVSNSRGQHLASDFILCKQQLSCRSYAALASAMCACTGKQLLLHKFSPRHQHLCAVIDSVVAPTTAEIRSLEITLMIIFIYLTGVLVCCYGRL